MDPSTLIGLAAGVAIIAYSMLSGSVPSMYLHIPSLIITGGGTIAVTLMHFPMKDMLGLVSVVKNAFFQKELTADKQIELISEISEKARKEGILSLEQRLNEINDKFLVKGLRMIIDGVKPEIVAGVLKNEIANMSERHKAGQKILMTMSTYGPAWGMIGTLVGLIDMLASMDDPSKIGMGMATAIITTFYGAVLANLICVPLAGKLETRAKQELIIKNLVLTGVVSIQANENPRMIREKLLTFLEPKLRKAA
jgi:chemotaxis protein MotA